MKVRLFEGPAGSGKTTRLFHAVGEHLAARPLERDQRVLALTKMHGSRRRMQAKLAEVLGRETLSECATLNSFVLGLVHRWRTLARTVADPIPVDDDFAALASLARQLLDHGPVVQWVASRYPLLAVDELQDLRGPELGVVVGLSKGLDVVCAADEFQELNPAGVCEGVEWARTHGEVVALSHVHRTRVPGLLAGAQSVRAGKGLSGGQGLKVFATPTANVAASFVANNLTWWRRSQVAVLSPTGPAASRFVQGTLARLRKPFKKKDSQTVGPFTLHWEATATDELKAWADLLGLDDGHEVAAAAIAAHEAILPGPLIDWVQNRGRIAGEVAFSAARIREQLGRAQSLVRAHITATQAARAGMTVHQAKNREFDRVILLWPVALGGGAEVKRRLLYNAITRAKQECLVLVEDPKPKQSVLLKAPFA